MAFERYTILSIIQYTQTHKEPGNETKKSINSRKKLNQSRTQLKLVDSARVCACLYCRIIYDNLMNIHWYLHRGFYTVGEFREVGL